MSDPENKLAAVASGRRDEDVAAEIKAEMVEALKPILEIMAKAAKHRMVVQWENLSADAFGRYQVNGLRVSRIF